jgi:hypothetical protein
MRAARHTWGIVIATAVATLVASLGPPPALAADDLVEIPVRGLEGTITYYGSGDLQGIAVLPPGDGGLQVATQCTPIPGVPSGLCVGSPTNGEQPPLDVIGLEELSPLVKWDEDASGALDWIVAEGEEYVRAMYDVPADDRIGRYARAELRQYLLDRLLNIMDKQVYGVALTEDEKKALAWVETETADRDRLLAQEAWEEYTRFKDSPCTYRPPVAPAYVSNPPVLPAKIATWCKQFKIQTSELFTFAPPLPPTQSFMTWASYRHAEELGLGAFHDPKVTNALAKLTVAMASATALAGGLVRAATLYGLTVARIAARELIRMITPHAGRIGAKVVSEAAKLALRQSALLSSIGSAIFIAIVVIVFAVVVGVASWQLLEHETVGSSLRANLDEALKNKDPFLLAPERAKNVGKPFNSALDPAKPPYYRSDESQQRLASLMTLWTTASRTGTVTGDPDGIWANPNRVASDPRWVVRVGDAAPVVRDQVVVPQAEGKWTRVGFSRGWMVLTPDQGGAPRPALSFGYRNQWGFPELIHRAPSSVGGFNVFSPADYGWDGAHGPQATLTWVNKDDKVVRARLQRPAPKYLQGPRPTAVGPLYAGRPVMLRPNPVGTSGESLDPATVQGDYEFDWTVERLDPATGQWSEIAVPDGFGTSFTPTQAGEHDARVTMTSLDDETDQRFGSVRFTVGSPPIVPVVATLQDDGNERLELDLQLTEEVPGDEMAVEVTWPGEIGEPDVVQQLSTTCFQTGPIECTTARTGLADSLVYEVTPATDLRRPVRVLVTNQTGGVFTRELHLGEGRPSLAGPPDGANAEEPGTVEVGEDVTQVVMPLSNEAGQQYYTVARLVPSPGEQTDFGLLDPLTGNTTGAISLPGVQGIYAELVEEGDDWLLQVRGAPDLTDLGSFEAPLVLVQTNGTRQLVMVVVHVVPTTGDRFRGGLQTDVDPEDFGVADRPGMFPAVLGGRAREASYDGRMCVRLARVDFGPTGPKGTRCGPLGEFYRADGTVRPFPFELLFPTGMPSGTYRADAWLTKDHPRVDNAPLGIGFLLTDADAYPAPAVDLGSVSATGTPLVGSRLRAAVGWVFPRDATLRYRWLRDGTPIRGATASAYDLRRADRGHRLSVRVTAARPDYTATVRTSPRTAVVRAP